MGFTLGLKSKREGVKIEYFLFLVSAFGSERKRLSFHLVLSRFNLVYQASKRIL